MKKESNKKSLDFKKECVVELNDAKMSDVNGGAQTTTWACVFIVLTTKFNISVYDAE